MTARDTPRDARDAHALDLRVLRYRNRPGTDEPALLALELVSAGRTHDALDVVDDALLHDPDDLDVLLGCALAAVRTERLAFAQLVLTRAAQRAPEWTEALTLLAQVLTLRGCQERAIEVARRAVASGATDGAVRALVRVEDWRLALDTRLAALRADPLREEPALLAHEFLAVDRAKDALAVIELGLGLEDDADLRRIEARTRARLGDHAGARRALERALELAPLWWEATLDLTVLMLDQGALLDAHALVEAGLRAQPDEGSLLALLGQVLDAMEEAGVAPPAATTGPVSTASDDATAPFLLEPRAQNATQFLLVAREEAPAAAPPARRDGSGAHRILGERRRSGWLPRITRSLVGSRARKNADAAVARA